jgi:hypothetical protein
MSEFKTNKISPRKGTTTTIGDSGDSVSTSGGSTINNAGTITTAGITGGTINNTTGEIYLRGEVDWKPGDIKTTSFTATDNQGFFVNTTSGEITVTLPASPSAGDVVGIKDYANTFDTNKCILNPNGNKIQGSTELFEITVEGSSIIIIYVDSTKGWVITDASKAADIAEGPSFIQATGGTITEDGDFKVHTFTGPGTFTVSSLANSPTNPQGGPNNVDYLVVAGGGSAAMSGGGGGAGGYRTTFPSPGCNAGAFPISATTYPITVGAGGSAPTVPQPATPAKNGSTGSNSIFSTITSAGGGGGGTGYNGSSSSPGSNGGSGGGGGNSEGPSTGGVGNTPPVSPPQGNNGGAGTSPTSGNRGGSGGGGASATGANGTPSGGGNGGNGSSNLITGSPVAYAGGGAGGAGGTPGCITAGTGGTGGGGPGGNISPAPNGTSGTANTGGGGGSNSETPSSSATVTGSGGSGIVIIRYKFQ